ncbi:MAG: monovalent cation/H(+) antiporter subunit G [Anaerolineales bacterium]|nr:monovalent cation/H(+) antiporter subunit G [Anaerolineales bacterium]
MDFILQLIAFLAVVVGTTFSVLGVLGMIRLPDVYTRLHATGKVSTFGVILLLVAAIDWTPLGFGKGLLLMLFLLMAGPVASHALSAAAYRLGIPMQAVRDDLEAALKHKGKKKGGGKREGKEEE